MLISTIFYVLILVTIMDMSNDLIASTLKIVEMRYSNSNLTYEALGQSARGPKMHLRKNTFVESVSYEM